MDLIDFAWTVLPQNEARREKMTKKTRSASMIVKRHEDEDVDACDVEFRESEATPDHELPPTRGGVEVVRAKRGRSVVGAKRRRRVSR
jgi:hypothetical protein